MKIQKNPNIKEWKCRQMQRVRAALDEHLNEAIKAENDRAEEAFKVAIMLVDLELRKLS